MIIIRFRRCKTLPNCMFNERYFGNMTDRHRLTNYTIDSLFFSQNSCPCLRNDILTHTLYTIISFTLTKKKKQLGITKSTKTNSIFVSKFLIKRQTRIVVINLGSERNAKAMWWFNLTSFFERSEKNKSGGEYV